LAPIVKDIVQILIDVLNLKTKRGVQPARNNGLATVFHAKVGDFKISRTMRETFLSLLHWADDVTTRCCYVAFVDGVVEYFRTLLPARKDVQDAIVLNCSSVPMIDKLREATMIAFSGAVTVAMTKETVTHKRPPVYRRIALHVQRDARGTETDGDAHGNDTAAELAKK